MIMKMTYVVLGSCLVFMAVVCAILAAINRPDWAQLFAGLLSSSGAGAMFHWYKVSRNAN